MTSIAPTAEPAVPDSEKPVFRLSTSRGFESWLASQNASIVFTTYTVGKIFFVGMKRDRKLWVFNRDVGRCLGVACNNADLWLASDAQIYRFRNAVTEQQPRPSGDLDAVYIPQLAYFTGDLDTHDVAIDGHGQVVFVNTRFNCLATVSDTHSFRALWMPPFISRLAAEDRCHVNGVALVDGRPKYVTCVSKTDVFEGWRDHRRDGGIVMDVETGEIACSGLSMPHSPRWNGGKLWVLNSGTGELGTINLAARSFEPLCFCPGFLRGLAFVGDRFAIVGLSKPRKDREFSGLPLDDGLRRREISARCGLYVIDITTGDIAHSVTIEGIVTELYDVALIRGVVQPSMVGLNSEEQKTTISIE